MHTRMHSSYTYICTYTYTYTFIHLYIHIHKHMHPHKKCISSILFITIPTTHAPSIKFYCNWPLFYFSQCFIFYHFRVHFLLTKLRFLNWAKEVLLLFAGKSPLVIFRTFLVCSYSLPFILIFTWTFFFLYCFA